MTKDEKIRFLQRTSNKELLQTFQYYIIHFNPIDDDVIESKELTEKEILSRMSTKKE